MQRLDHSVCDNMTVDLLLNYANIRSLVQRLELTKYQGLEPVPDLQS